MSLTDLDFTQEEVEELLAHATPEELKELDSLLTSVTSASGIVLEPHQIPPPGLWRLWLLMAGRGAGKTQACAHYMNEHATGPPCSNTVSGGHRMAIIAPTLGDAFDACVEGPSGIRTLNPDVRVTGGLSGTTVRWPNGATARLFGTNTPTDVERLRAGGNRCLAWLEELAAWRYLSEGLAHMRFGLRVGAHPRAIGSTTPKPRPEIKALVREAENADVGTVISTGTTYDNPHLSDEVKADLLHRYQGTRLGDQELLGQVLADAGDVFKTSWFNRIVVDSPVPTDLRGSGWRQVRAWDLAATEAPETYDPIERMRLRQEGNDPDWTAGARVAWHAESRTLCIEDMRHVRRSSAAVEALILATAAGDGRGLPIRMEQEGGASGKTVIANYARLLRGYTYAGWLPSGDKVVRAQSWATLAEQGNLILVAGDWIAPFINECDEFTRDDTHDHDDMIDAVSVACAYLLGPPQRRGGLSA